MQPGSDAFDWKKVKLLVVLVDDLSMRAAFYDQCLNRCDEEGDFKSVIFARDAAFRTMQWTETLGRTFQLDRPSWMVKSATRTYSVLFLGDGEAVRVVAGLRRRESGLVMFPSDTLVDDFAVS